VAHIRTGEASVRRGREDDRIDLHRQPLDTLGGEVTLDGTGHRSVTIDVVFRGRTCEARSEVF
jgi:hypothetical protein